MSVTGACLCGAVRFEVTGPFLSANYCHCTHCQRRTGTGSSANARVAAEHVSLIDGADLVRSYTPEGCAAKFFCSQCGSALYSEKDDLVGVRLGALDVDPPLRPQVRQFVRSAVSWEEIPEDGLPRYEGSAQ